jgi:hypothetical protein
VVKAEADASFDARGSNEGVAVEATISRVILMRIASTFGEPLLDAVASAMGELFAGVERGVLAPAEAERRAATGQKILSDCERALASLKQLEATLAAAGASSPIYQRAIDDVRRAYAALSLGSYE